MGLGSAAQLWGDVIGDLLFSSFSLLFLQNGEDFVFLCLLCLASPVVECLQVGSHPRTILPGLPEELIDNSDRVNVSRSKLLILLIGT